MEGIRRDETTRGYLRRNGVEFDGEVSMTCHHDDIVSLVCTACGKEMALVDAGERERLKLALETIVSFKHWGPDAHQCSEIARKALAGWSVVTRVQELEAEIARLKGELAKISAKSQRRIPAPVKKQQG